MEQKYLVRNRKTDKPMWTWVLALFCFGTLTMTACGNNKSSSSTPPQILGGGMRPPNGSFGYGNGYANCSGCMTNGGQMALLATTDSQKPDGGMYLGLDFYGLINGANYMNTRIALQYSGQVQAHGIMRIYNVDSMMCNAPPGDYQVDTYQVGTWQNGVVGGGAGPSGLQLIAQGTNGIQIVMTMSKGVIYNPSYSYGSGNIQPDHLYGALVFQSVGNQPCTGMYVGPTPLQ